MWNAYMEAATMDARRHGAHVCGHYGAGGRGRRIVELPVADNQFVHKGDLLLVIEPTDYTIALKLAEAVVQQAQATAQNAAREAERRRKLSDIAVTLEERQTFNANAVAADAQYHQAIERRDQAKVNLERTRICSPVNGWVTNLLAQLGDYASVGKNVISVVDADLLLGGRLFRRDTTGLHPRRRSRRDQIDGL